MILPGDKPDMSYTKQTVVGFLRWIAWGQFCIEGLTSLRRMWWATVGRALSYGVSISHKSDLDKTLGPSDSDPRLTPYGGRREAGQNLRRTR